jgi:hypothetical protein
MLHIAAEFFPPQPLSLARQKVSRRSQTMGCIRRLIIRLQKVEIHEEIETLRHKSSEVV